MFEPSDTPRLFGLASGVDFPAQLVAGLTARMADQPPEALARVELYVNTERMARRVQAAFDDGPARLLPRIRLLSDLIDPAQRARLPRPVPPLRRRLELTALVARLLEAAPDLAPRAALFDLSDSLAGLLEEMQIEDIAPEVILGLDVSDQSGHWQRALRFVEIVQGFLGEDAAPDRAGVARMALEMRLEAWRVAPPAHPVIVAGSTGSRGTTHAFMKAVAGLPQGAVVLPGFDFDTPQAIWDRLDDPLRGEDHPQFRFARLMRELELPGAAVPPWTDTPPPSPARNKVLSLALRPAPVTHQWMTEGPKLPDLPQAMAGVTLLEAPSPRQEARAIALRLRQAAEEGITAALVSPDRMLTRQVTAALDRWGILPDDSAGQPAQLTPPGRFLRHVASLFLAPLSAPAALALLKHPLCHRGQDRGPHLLNTRELELHIRAKAWAYPQPEALQAWGVAQDRADWANWLARDLCNQQVKGSHPLTFWVSRHLALAEALCAGPEGLDPQPLWEGNAGRKLHQITQDLLSESVHGTEMTARDYVALFTAIVGREEVRDRDAPHPHILIWGTQEARVAGADLTILAGLNEGSWPSAPNPDPWLNRSLRAQAGMLLPDREIGLSAHDFQQAAGGGEVWLSRAVKSDEAETVPARWLNRVINLMGGLPQRDGPQALHEMRSRGADWLAMAEGADTPIPSPRAPRPSPAPPTAVRPHHLSVTQIKHLIRDPYAIYAKHVLGLRALDPMMRPPDALLRGILLHEVLEEFVTQTRDTAPDPAVLRQISAQVLGDPARLPYPTMRLLWQARIDRIADWFAQGEVDRRSHAAPQHFEIKGRAEIPELGFVLSAKADRIDIDDRGGAHIYDYKTGSAPSKPQQLHFDKQLLLEAAMVEQHAFEGLAPRHVERAVFIALSPSSPGEVPAPLDDQPPAEVWADFTKLVARMLDADQGYTARRALQKDTDTGDYDHLARFGEWDVTDRAEKERLE